MSLSRRDPGQVLQAAFDDETQTLRTTATFSGSSFELSINQIDDNIAIGDGTDLFTGTTLDGKHAQDVNVLNQIDFTASGLKTGLQSYSVTITDSPTVIPQIAGQNSVSIRIWGAANVYFGDNSVTPSQGYPFRQFEAFQLDVQDDSAVLVYAICDTGSTCDVRVFALA